MIPELKLDFRLVLCSTQKLIRDSDQCLSRNSFHIDPSSPDKSEVAIREIAEHHPDISTVLFFSGGSWLTEEQSQRPYENTFEKNTMFPLRCLDFFINCISPRQIRFIFFSSGAIHKPSSGIAYASAKAYLELAVRGLCKQFASTNLSFSMIRLGYVRTPDRYHEQLRKVDYASYLEKLSLLWPNFSPIECNDIVKTIRYIHTLDAIATNGLFIDLSGARD